ncbi:DUF4382 domain-containing protein [Belliella sp. DSM 111904]|uniref:DUF4382 domain-containing protein n=1 Tax=Belliella filtrata TaxID=2923435 RepID=A0ABS9UZI4_9BACT|nr:DUF4382 domain-containing protein [Belliella filtrata]MCH7409572.1 DUF4382 domain-containing protein [Belliella filtrata]
MKKYCIILLLLPFLNSCTSDQERTKSLVNVFLVDAPADIDALWVEVLGVDLQTAAFGDNANGESQYFPYEAGNKRVDIAQLVGDQELLIGRGEVNSGTLQRLTLRLGAEKYVMKNDVRTDLTLNSEQEEGLSIDVDFTLRPGISHDIYIDFDILNSLMQNGTSDFTFSPKLRAFSKANTGEITGVLRPTGQNAYLYAVQQRDSISTGVNFRGSGGFRFKGLEGTYTVFVIPKDNSFLADTIRTVIVQSQQTTDLGNITLRPRE